MFSDQQIAALEARFAVQKRLSLPERVQFAAELQISEVQVKTWFMLRWMKEKNQRRQQINREVGLGNREFVFAARYD